MKTKRVLAEILLLGTVVACALAFLFATLGAAAGAAAGALGPQSNLTASEQTFHGMITCSQCGAKHSPASGKTASDCVRTCVDGGARFSLVDGDQTYLLDGDLAALKKVAGERAQVVGALQGKTIKVSSIGST